MKAVDCKLVRQCHCHEGSRLQTGTVSVTAMKAVDCKLGSVTAIKAVDCKLVRSVSLL